MKLYEYEGKGLFNRAGIRIPRGQVICAVKQAKGLIDEYGSAMVKAQTLWGKRGLHGAVLPCDTQADIEEAVVSLLKKKDMDEKIEKILVEERLPVATEVYLSVTYHGKRPLVIISPRGGIDIEEVNRKSPGEIFREPIDILKGLDFETAVNVVRRAGFGDDETEHIAGVLIRLYRMFVDDDCILAEINPLIGTPYGEWYAADAKVEIDDEAFYRQSQLMLPERLPSGKKPTRLETLALENDRIDTRGAAGRMFFELPEGSIIVFASGGGTSIEALDDLHLLGGKPAIFTEYSGNPSAEKVKGLTRIALMHPGPINAIWVVGGRANFTDVYETLVNGFMAGIEEIENFDRTMPIIIRRAGPRDEEAFETLRRISREKGYNIFLRGMATSIANSARIVMYQASVHAEKSGQTVNGGLNQDVRAAK
jgi:succinyl-CoA synthetase beta subunit